jgi:hypothetical protein
MIHFTKFSLRIWHVHFSSTENRLWQTNFNIMSYLLLLIGSSSVSLRRSPIHYTFDGQCRFCTSHWSQRLQNMGHYIRCTAKNMKADQTSETLLITTLHGTLAQNATVSHTTAPCVIRRTRFHNRVRSHWSLRGQCKERNLAHAQFCVTSAVAS